MLTSYQSQVQRLLHDASATLYPTSDLTAYINEARRQLAIESQSCRAVQTYSLASSTASVLFSAVTAPANVQSLLEVRQMFAGTAWVAPRTWEWFSLYYLMAPGSGAPTLWSQFGDGANAAFYIAPVPPSGTTTLTLDGTWLPLDLANDSTAEALPVPWQDAVKYFAAYLAYLNAQRPGDAERMMQLYEITAARARRMTKPTALPGLYNTDWSPQPQGAQP